MPRTLSLPSAARAVHAWAGAALSLLVIVVASTGALLVWKDAYLWATIPAARAMASGVGVNSARAAGIVAQR